MVKDDPRFKEKFSLQDRINTIEFIVNACFTEDSESGEVAYTPYYRSVAQIISVANYFMEGIEFEEDEDIYSSIQSDEEIKAMIDTFLYDGRTGGKILEDIATDVDDIIDFKKRQLIAKAQDESNGVLAYKMLELMEKQAEREQLEIDNNIALKENLEFQNEVNKIVSPEMQKKFVENFDMNDIMDAMVDRFSENELHKKNSELVTANRKIREQDNKIIDLQTAYAQEVQKDNMKNVLADNGKKDKTEETPKPKKRGRPPKSVQKVEE